MVYGRIWMETLQPATGGSATGFHRPSVLTRFTDKNWENRRCRRARGFETKTSNGPSIRVLVLGSVHHGVTVLAPSSARPYQGAFWGYRSIRTVANEVGHGTTLFCGPVKTPGCRWRLADCSTVVSTSCVVASVTGR